MNIVINKIKIYFLFHGLKKCLWVSILFLLFLIVKIENVKLILWLDWNVHIVVFRFAIKFTVKSFLFTYLSSIKFLYYFISLYFIYRVLVHITIQSYGSNNLHMPALYTLIFNIGSTSIILHEHTYKSGGIF
jgi:hypothetical protein